MTIRFITTHGFTPPTQGDAPGYICFGLSGLCTQPSSILNRVHLKS